MVKRSSGPRKTNSQKAYGELKYNHTLQSKANNDLFYPPTEFAGCGYELNDFIDPYSSLERYQIHTGIYGDGYRWGGTKHSADHRRIAQSRLLYKTEGIIQTIVHLLADFVTEQISIVHTNETVARFYNAWAVKVKLKKTIYRIVVDLLTTGNVFLWSLVAQLKKQDEQTMKKGIKASIVGNDLVITLENKKCKSDKIIKVEIEGDEINSLSELREACMENALGGQVNKVIAETRNAPETPSNPFPEPEQKIKIPWGYISLNPLQIEPRGSRIANEHYWVMLLAKQDIKPLAKYMDYSFYSDISITKVNLPEVFKNKLKGLNNNELFGAELKLDPERLSVIQDITKADYEEWATPQIYPAYKDVRFKRLMRMGEVSAMESMRNMITLIKLGNVKEGYIPTEEQLQRVASALAGGSQAHHLVWDDLISGEVLQPDLGSILDPKKYEQVDRDIFTSMGLSSSIFSGQGTYANNTLTVKLLMEKIKTLRSIVEDWLVNELKKIAVALKFKRFPNIVWGLMELRDENVERKLWLDLYDRGLVSDQSLLERFGTDFEIEKARQEIEADLKQSANPEMERPPIMESKGPYRQSKEEKGDKGGRPILTNTPQQNKRNTKPKGIANINLFNNLLDEVNDFINISNIKLVEKAVSTAKVRDFRSLKKEDKIKLEGDLIDRIINFKPSKFKLVYDLKDKILSLYKEQVSVNTTKNEKLKIIATIYASVYAGLM